MMTEILELDEESLLGGGSYDRQFHYLTEEQEELLLAGDDDAEFTNEINRGNCFIEESVVAIGEPDELSTTVGNEAAQNNEYKRDDDDDEEDDDDHRHSKRSRFVSERKEDPLIKLSPRISSKSQNEGQAITTHTTTGGYSPSTSPNKSSKPWRKTEPRSQKMWRSSTTEHRYNQNRNVVWYSSRRTQQFENNRRSIMGPSIMPVIAGRPDESHEMRQVLTAAMATAAMFQQQQQQQQQQVTHAMFQQHQQHHLRAHGQDYMSNVQRRMQLAYPAQNPLMQKPGGIRGSLGSVNNTQSVYVNPQFQSVPRYHPQSQSYRHRVPVHRPTHDSWKERKWEKRQEVRGVAPHRTDNQKQVSQHAPNLPEHQANKQKSGTFVEHSPGDIVQRPIESRLKAIPVSDPPPVHPLDMKAKRQAMMDVKEPSKESPPKSPKRRRVPSPAPVPEKSAKLEDASKLGVDEAYLQEYNAKIQKQKQMREEILRKKEAQRKVLIEEKMKSLKPPGAPQPRQQAPQPQQQYPAKPKLPNHPQQYGWKQSHQHPPNWKFQAHQHRQQFQNQQNQQSYKPVHQHQQNQHSQFKQHYHAHQQNVQQQQAIIQGNNHNWQALAARHIAETIHRLPAEIQTREGLILITFGKITSNITSDEITRLCQLVGKIDVIHFAGDGSAAYVKFRDGSTAREFVRRFDGLTLQGCVLKMTPVNMP